MDFNIWDVCGVINTLRLINSYFVIPVMIKQNSNTKINKYSMLINKVFIIVTYLIFLLAYPNIFL